MYMAPLLLANDFTVNSEFLEAGFHENPYITSIKKNLKTKL